MSVDTMMLWKDSEDIAEALYERYPDMDPLKLRFTELHDKVVSLPDFKDRPEKSNEGILEKILLAWLDLREDNA